MLWGDFGLKPTATGLGFGICGTPGLI